jgi:copper chaperone CopZ
MIAKLFILALAFNNITFKVTGLTCSMCSFSVQKSIEKVYFVESVNANIEETTFEVQFKKDHYVDFYALQDAVEDSGFFIDKPSVVIDAKNTNEFWQNSNYIIWKNK